MSTSNSQGFMFALKGANPPSHPSTLRTVIAATSGTTSTITPLTVTVPAGTVATDHVLVVTQVSSNAARTVTVTGPTPMVPVTLVPFQVNDSQGWAVFDCTGLVAGNVITVNYTGAVAGRIAQGWVFTAPVGAVGAIGTRANSNQAFITAPGRAINAGARMLVLAIEYSTSTTTSVIQRAVATGEALAQLSFYEAPSTAGYGSIFLGEFNAYGDPSGVATVTYSHASPTGVGIQIVEMAGQEQPPFAVPVFGGTRGQFSAVAVLPPPEIFPVFGNKRGTFTAVVNPDLTPGPPVPVPPVMDPIQAALRESKLQIAVLDVYDGSTLVEKEVNLVSGSITASRKNNTRRSLNAVIALNSWEDLNINCTSSRVQVWLGFEIYPGQRQIWSQGVFRVNQVSRNRMGDLTIQGTSLESYVIDDRFFTPRTPPQNTSTIVAIKNLILESFPTAQFLVTATKDKTVQMTAPWERERWEAINALADTIDAQVYNNMEGKFVIENKTDFATGNQNPVWIVNEGADGILVSETVSNTRERVYNAVVVSGLSSDEKIPPVSFTATDNNPQSKTYWGGPFGHVTKFYSNPGFTTVTQCSETAINMLAEAIAENRTVSFEMIPMPNLHPGDVIQLDMLDGTKENHVIEEMRISLNMEAFSAETLASKAEDTSSG